MRTTLDVDEDVLHAVKERARRERRSAGAVISELARQALTAPGPPGDEQDVFFGFRPLPRRGGVVTSALVNQLMDEEGV
jgi:hypothetical protein